MKQMLGSKQNQVKIIVINQKSQEDPKIVRSR